jgi:hypothetical protein
MFKSQKIISNHRVLIKHTLHTYDAPAFAPDYSATVLVTVILTQPPRANYHILLSIVCIFLH